MSSREFSKCLLESVALQATYIDPVKILLTLKVLVLSCSHKGSECLERYVSVQSGYRVDKFV